MQTNTRACKKYQIIKSPLFGSQSYISHILCLGVQESKQVTLDLHVFDNGLDDQIRSLNGIGTSIDI